MKKNLINFFWMIGLCLSCTLSFAQKTVTVNYSTSNLNSSLCNVFNTATLQVIGGLTHYPLAGGIGFNGTTVILQCENGTTMATQLGAGYAIQYPFKKGYKYNLQITVSKVSSDANSNPFLDLSLWNTLPAASSTDPGACGPVSQTYWMNAMSSTAIYANYVNTTSPTTITIGAFVSPSPFNYLALVASQGSATALTDVKITSLVITESVDLSVSPSPVSLACGSPATQTFTVANPNNAAGINSYTWTFSSNPSGWLYNGSPTPPSITTTTNTLTLSTAGCGALPTYFTVAANLTGYSNRAGTVSASLAPFSISGTAGPLCSGSSNYSIANLNCPSATVTWSVAPAGIASLSCTSCAQTSLTRVGNGTITLTANVSGACSSAPATLTQNVQVGAPQLRIVANPQGACSGNTQSWFLTVDPIGIAGNYNWYVANVGTGSSIYISNSSGSSTFADVVGGGQVGLTYTDQCNNTGHDGVTIYSTCHAMRAAYSITPNPASDVLTITSNPPDPKVFSKSATTSPTAKNNPKGNGSIQQIRIFNASGVVRKVLHYSNQNYQSKVNVADLAPGIYFVEISDGTSVTNEKIVVQR